VSYLNASEVMIREEALYQLHRYFNLYLYICIYLYLYLYFYL